MILNGSPPGLAQTQSRTWVFAGREFDEARLELRVQGSPVELELKPLEVLLTLLQHAGEVVTKEELLKAVWPGLNVVEGSLSTAVHKLRRAMGDDVSSVIVTVPRVGYRLAASAECTPKVSQVWQPLNLRVGQSVPGRAHWRLVQQLDTGHNGEVWLAEQPKTSELRVFKFCNADRLAALKREVTVFRFLRESLADASRIVHIFEWNLDAHPYFLEAEYGGLNLAQWAENRGGSAKIPLPTRIGMLADIARIVAAAHAAGVLHKDLKPSNILVAPKPEGGWHIKIADFGSASLTDPSRLEALGITNLGFTQTAEHLSSALTGTLMYIAPELLSGASPTAASDVYALGVILYQSVIGDFRKPLTAGWEEGIEDPLIREDIRATACGEPARRLPGAAELAQHLDDLDHRRAERARREDASARARVAERKRADARARRPWIALFGVAILSLLASLYFLRRPARPAPSLKTVAVLPFQNIGSGQDSEFLGLSLADEVATSLSYARGLSVRPLSASSQYSKADPDPQKVGEELKVSDIVTGHFLQEGDRLYLTLEAIDVNAERVLWRDTIEGPAGTLIDLRDKLVARTQGSLAAALGASAYTVDRATRPKSEQAYNLYLRAAVPFDARLNKQAIAMLEKSVGLDPDFAPAWMQLGRRYYIEGRYNDGGNEMMERGSAALERALRLDPAYIEATAFLTGWYVEAGDLAKADREAEGLLHRRPDNADAHYILSYTLRYAGLLDESSTQCDLSFALDPHTQTSGLRSCAITFALRGDYQRAQDYLKIDPNSDFSKAILLTTLLRAGKEKEALQIGPPHIPQWKSYDLLPACIQRKSGPEVGAAIAQISADPEANYLAAANLAYCGQTDAALRLLKQAVAGNYCSYPAMDIDPLLDKVRARPEFAEIRSAGLACQQTFVRERE